MTPRVGTFCRVVIRAKKHANKAAPAAAEWAEQKTGTKGKAGQSHTQRLPSDPASGRAGLPESWLPPARHRHDMGVPHCDHDLVKADWTQRSGPMVRGGTDAVTKSMRKLVSAGHKPHIDVLHRHLTALGWDCHVVAPSLIPRPSGERRRSCSTQVIG
jgi:hypothetical protein